MNKKEFSSFLKEAFFISLGRDALLIGWEKLKKDEKGEKAEKLSFYFPDFFLSQKAWVSFKKWEVFSFHSFKKMILDLSLDLNFEVKFSQNPMGGLSKPKRAWVDPEKKFFLEKVLEIKKRIQKGDLIKALPIAYEMSEGVLRDDEKCFFLLSLFQNQVAGGTLYGFWNLREGLLGRTPEMLFDWNQKRNVLLSMALAGTGPDSLKGSLLEDIKEVEEHLIVVEDLQNKLKRLGTVWKSEVFEWPYGSLKHLRTDFFLKLKNPSLDDQGKALKKNKLDIFKMIELFHPTPALGIFSKTLKKTKIIELEKKINPIRKYFGAPFCVFFPQEKRFLCLVAIRNLQWFDQKTYLMSGCGLISKSDPNKEWEELKWKRESLKRQLFGNASILPSTDPL